MKNVCLLIVVLLVSNFAKSQNIFTVGDVYNYEVGDEICTSSQYGNSTIYPPPSPKITKILSKSYNIDSTELTYGVQETYFDVHGNPPNFDTTITTNTSTLFYTNLDFIIGPWDTLGSNHFFYNLPMCYQTSGAMFNVDTILADTSILYDLLPARIWQTQGCGSVEPCYMGLMYIKGVGGPFGHFYFTAEVCVIDWKFNYAIKNNGQDTIGNYRRLATSVNELKYDSKQVTVYPNPTHNIITITTKGNEIKDVFLINSNGQVVCQRRAVSNSLEIDLSQFAGGLYLLRFVDKNGAVGYKKVIKE